MLTLLEDSGSTGDAQVSAARSRHHTIAAWGSEIFGVKVAGGVAALYMPMAPKVAAAFFAVAKIGAIVMPLFSGFGPRPLAPELPNTRNQKIMRRLIRVVVSGEPLPELDALANPECLEAPGAAARDGVSI